jgi:hypothetical protein
MYPHFYRDRTWRTPPDAPAAPVIQALDVPYRASISGTTLPLIDSMMADMNHLPQTDATRGGSGAYRPVTVTLLGAGGGGTPRSPTRWDSGVSENYNLLCWAITDAEKALYPDLANYTFTPQGTPPGTDGAPVQRVFATLENQMGYWFAPSSLSTFKQAGQRFHIRYTIPTIGEKLSPSTNFAAQAAGAVDRIIERLRDWALSHPHGTILAPGWEINGSWFAWGFKRSNYAILTPNFVADYKAAMLRWCRILRSAQGTSPASGWNNRIMTEMNWTGDGSWPTYSGTLTRGENFYTGDYFPDAPTERVWKLHSMQGYSNQGTAQFNAPTNIGGSGPDRPGFGWFLEWCKGVHPSFQAVGRVGPIPLGVGEWGTWDQDDNAAWVQAFMNWIISARTAGVYCYNSYFEHVGGPTLHSLTAQISPGVYRQPNARAAYQSRISDGYVAALGLPIAQYIEGADTTHSWDLPSLAQKGAGAQNAGNTVSLTVTHPGALTTDEYHAGFTTSLPTGWAATPVCTTPGQVVVTVTNIDGSTANPALKTMRIRQFRPV